MRLAHIQEFTYRMRRFNQGQECGAYRLVRCVALTIRSDPHFVFRIPDAPAKGRLSARFTGFCFGVEGRREFAAFVHVDEVSGIVCHWTFSNSTDSL